MPATRLSACVLAAAGALGLGWLATKARASSASNCPKLLVLGSRGSGTGPDSANWGNGLGLPGVALVQSLQGKLGTGQVRFEHNPYEAVGIIPPIEAVVKALGSHLIDLKADIELLRQAFNGIGALARLPWVGAYKASVHQGEGDLLGQIQAFESTACSARTKLVLTGYSQGAQVTGDVYQSLPSGVKSKVLAVVLFGDPHYNPNDSSDRFGLNAAASQRWTHNQGILGHRAAFNSRVVLSFCHRSDPICQGLGQIWHGFGQHNNYQSLGEPQIAAAYIAQRLNGPSGVLPNKWPFSRHDRLPFWAYEAVAFTPSWDSCNKRWCLLAESLDSGGYWVWAVRISSDPTQTGSPYLLETVTSPTKPPARKVLEKAWMRAESDADCNYNGPEDCPIFTFSQQDINQLLAR